MPITQKYIDRVCIACIRLSDSLNGVYAILQDAYNYNVPKHIAELLTRYSDSINHFTAQVENYMKEDMQKQIDGKLIEKEVSNDT